MNVVTITAAQSARLYWMLKIDFCVMLAQSTEGKLQLLEEMHDNAVEEAQLAITKAMGK